MAGGRRARGSGRNVGAERRDRAASCSGDANAVVVDERSERVGRRFEAPVIIATLLVVPVLVLEGTSVNEPWPTIAIVGDWIIWLVFLAEVVVLLAVTPDRRGWIRRHPLD